MKFEVQQYFMEFAVAARMGPKLPVDSKQIPVHVQADLGMKLDELVSVQLCLFLFNSVFHACVYLFYLIQFFMHAR